VPGRILIIDDDPVNVKILGDFLVRKGVEVDRATDGEEALVTYERSRPDLVLLDVLLPKINGLELCRRIKSAGSAPPVFLMSAVYRSPSIQRDACADYGADGYFVKPFRIQELWQKIEGRMGMLAPPEEGSPIEGALGVVGFARLLMTLAAAEETGALRLSHGHVEKLIYLERGQPVAVTSNLRSERFEQFLADQGVDRQAVTDPGELARLAELHVEERLIACFMMREGSFRFSPGVRAPTGLPRAAIPVARLILEGVRRNLPLIELSQEIERVRRRVVHAPPDAQATLEGIELAPSAQTLLRSIDGKSTVEEIVTRSGVPAPEAMQILFGFILLGVAAVEEATRGSA
jgi:CheY-like chemotaxis protein